MSKHKRKRETKDEEELVKERRVLPRHTRGWHIVILVVVSYVIGFVAGVMVGSG